MVPEGANESKAVIHLRDPEVHDDDVWFGFREQESGGPARFRRVNLMSGVLQYQSIQLQKLAIVVH